MSAVTVNVRGPAAMTAYYRDALALTVLREGGRTPPGAWLGALVELVETTDLPLARPGGARLFTTALLHRP